MRNVIRTGVIGCAIAGTLASQAIAQTPTSAQSSTSMSSAALDTVRNALMQADRDFASVTAAKGLEGWRSFWADDASSWRGSKGFVQGADTLRVLQAQMFSDSTRQLQWTPTDATAWSNELGATTGTYKLLTKQKDRTLHEEDHGTYLTVWRKTAAGWRVILDGGYSEAKK